MLLSDAPEGKPIALPSKTESRQNEKVVFTCNTNNTDANPDCDTFIWDKIGNSSGQFPTILFTNTLEFIMEESSVGNYTCQCTNRYGSSPVSRAVEVVLTTSSSSGIVFT